MRRLTRVAALLLAIALLTGCAAGMAFRRGNDRAREGDWDTAVTFYRQAVQADPDKAEFRIALSRAMLNASHAHFDRARELEAKDQLDAALAEYKSTVEFDPANRQAADKVVQLERTIRERIEASRPKPAIARILEEARRAAAAPLLNPASRVPFSTRFTQASLREVLTFIAQAAGINVTYDPSFTTTSDRAVTVTLEGTLEQVLNTLMMSNGLFYSVLDDKTIVVAVDNQANRLRYERQVALVIPIQYADSTELLQMLTQITRVTTGSTIPPVIVANKTANTITVRGTQPVIDIIRQLIASNDKPRAEVAIDVEVLEVNRNRTKQLGLNLTQYQIGGTFSPEAAPPATGANPPFNLNTISQGVSTSDFYLSVPQAFVRMLETDTRTKVLAQTQLRGAEGSPLTLDIGAREPYLATTFSPLAAGGANVNPVSSYNFEQVGISVTATPRVTDGGDILLELQLNNAALGPSRTVGGSPAPSFTNRKVTTKLRLRDGESHLLAGLLQDEERRTMRGFPGVVNLPVLKHLFSDTDSEIEQTDIVMLLTPRIIRTHEWTAGDLSPIHLGTNQNLGLTGPPPLIAAQPDAAAPGTAAPGTPPAGVPPPQGALMPGLPGGAPSPATTPGGIAPLAEPQLTTMPSPPPTTLAPTAQVSVTAPAGDVRVASGPYMVPVYITGVSRLSTASVTITYNPAALRVRTIQEGAFLRQGGATASMTPNIDHTSGRVDLAFVRSGDAVGASGSGLLAGIQFDAIAPGSSPLGISGVATNPAGATIPLQFVPASVVVR